MTEQEKPPVSWRFFLFLAGGNGMENYTYIERCKDGSLYTGWTNDIERRLEMHNQGKGAKYTRGRRPVKLIYLEKFSTREEAMKREAAIKKLKRKEKLLLIQEYQQEKEK